MPSRCKVRNWSDYNKGLCKRGSINLYLSEKILLKWKNAPKGRGRRSYSDSVIEMCWAIRVLYRFPFRATQGFLESLFNSLGYKNWVIPDYTTICRRGKSLSLKLPVSIDRSQPIEILVDASGVRIHQGPQRKRFERRRDPDALEKRSEHEGWRKVHLGINSDTLEIMSIHCSDSSVGDGQRMKDILDDIPRVKRVIADGGYDSGTSYQAIYDKGAEPVIPPRVNAASQKGKKGHLLARDKNIEWIKERTNLPDPKKAWKVAHGYHVRSRVENTFFRFKKSFGNNFLSDGDDNIATETLMRAVLLNKFIQVASPVSDII